MSEHPIPPITHPLGHRWDQPPREAVLVDATHAVMDRRAFEALPNYESSIPSGVYEGKMWRCGMRLRWFDAGPKPDTCRIEQRTILLVGSAS